MRITSSLVSRKRLLFAACAAAATVCTGSARAANISWTDSPISADADVDNARGSLSYAYAFGSDGSAGVPVVTTAVNGVTFTAFATNNGGGAGTLVTQTSSDGNVTLTSPNGFLTGFGDFSSPTASTVSSSYGTLLNSAIYNSAGTTNATLTVSLNNLSLGHAYEVQVWVNDSREAGDVYNREEDITGGASTAGPLDYNYTYASSGNTNGNGSNGGAGEFATGTFIADGTTQLLTLTPLPTGSIAAQIQALQLRDIGIALPEPTSLALIGMAALASLRRRR